ncbi:hypothetical protein HO173_002366 [Letharia columbiana]|uniref:WSC domain-containing protein n=1 Tax=Letharia columbiana TaxID=112416 RepID=A0A8H6G3G5_9LECA|nr:uncharacterized protein HO173_002366 [Letharia columbiana]KAF6239820.1 hypothetical protein HO173_002366 [Letharia columbiana]
MATPIWRRLGARPFIQSLAVLLAFAAPRPSVQLSQELCSSQNTGSDSNAVSNHFNSNGACQTACSGFAFAVVQNQNCWCSNYSPADTTSTGNCSEACPGYPYENCGSASSGLFGYVALGNAPSGTIGASTSTSTTSTPTPTPTTTPTPIPTPAPTPTTSDTLQAVSTQPLPGVPLGTTSSPEATSSSTSSTPSVLSTVLPTTGPPTAIPSAANPETVTESPSVSISFVSITPSTTSTSSTSQPIPVSLNLTPTTTSTPTTLTTSSTPTTIAKSSTTTSSSSWSATPFTSVTTVTGQIKTLTITPTSPPATATTIITAAKENNGGFFSSSGKVAGTFVAVSIVLLLLIAGVIWFFLRRSRRRQPEPAAISSVAGSSTPQRRPSRLSQMGLVGAGGPQREKTGPTIPVIQTSGWGPSNRDGSEKSPADTLSAVERRSSYPRVVDQRLEPTALWNPLHDNGSHVSVRSFRDDQDYSRRMLRIANPDDG